MSTKKKPKKKQTPVTSGGSDVITSVGDVKVAAEVAYQTLVKGMGSVLAAFKTFELPSGTYTRGELVSIFQQRIAAAETTKASNSAWRDDVAAEREVAAKADPLRAEVKQLAIARLGKTSQKLKLLGFAPKKVRPVPVATKAAAQTKAQATRAKNTGKGTPTAGGT
jgi:hypothetical protein